MAADPAVQGTTREQADLGQRLQTVPAPTLQGEAPVVSESKPGAETGQKETFSFVLNGVNITRATVYDTAEFEPLYKEFIGTEVTLGSLREIADRIEAKYREDGYVATRAIIPPQAIKDGVPTVEVYEGRVVYYEINGEIGPVKKQIAKLLDNMVTGKPARWSELERYLLLARDLPGISLTGTLRSAGDTVPGGVVVVIDTARKAMDGFLNAQNLSAEATGPDTASGGLALNSNTSVAERVGFVALATVLQPLEQLSGFMSYQQSIGGDGLLFKASGTRTFSRPGAALKGTGIVNDSMVANFQLEYPLVRSRNFSLWTRGGFEYLDQRSQNRKANAKLFDDQLRVFFAGMRGVWRPWGGGLTQFDLEVRRGVDGLGASSISTGRSRLGSKPDFLDIRGKLEHLQPLNAQWSVDIKGFGQYATKTVSSIEALSLGDLTVGRGFEAGSVIGDYGFGIASEVRLSTMDFVADALKQYIDRVELYGFYDFGRAYDHDPALPSKYQDVSSVGLGFRIQAIQTLYADFYIAVPLQKGLETETKKPPTSVYFNVTKYF